MHNVGLVAVSMQQCNPNRGEGVGGAVHKNPAKFLVNDLLAVIGFTAWSATAGLEIEKLL